MALSSSLDLVSVIKPIASFLLFFTQVQISRHREKPMRSFLPGWSCVVALQAAFER